MWEENESLVISNCGIEVPMRGSWKKSIETGHPVQDQSSISFSEKLLTLSSFGP